MFSYMDSVQRSTSMLQAILQVPQIKPPRLACLDLRIDTHSHLMVPYADTQHVALLTKAIKQTYLPVEPVMPVPRVTTHYLLKSCWTAPNFVAMARSAYIASTVDTSALRSVWPFLAWCRPSPVWMDLATRRLSARAVERQLISVGGGLCCVAPSLPRHQRLLEWVSNRLSGDHAAGRAPTRREVAKYLARRVRRLWRGPAQPVFRVCRDELVQRVRWPALLTTLQPSAP